MYSATYLILMYIGFSIWTRGFCIRSNVGTWYLWTTVRPTCVVRAWPHDLCSGDKPEPPELPGCLNVTQRWKPTGDTSFNHYWSLWAPWGQYKPSSPFLLPLSTQPSERRSAAVQLTFSIPLSTQPSERRSPLFLLNFNGGEVQLSTHRARETSSQSKLYQPSSRPDWSRLIKPSKRQRHAAPANGPQHKSCITRQNHKNGSHNQQDDVTGLQTAQLS